MKLKLFLVSLLMEIFIVRQLEEVKNLLKPSSIIIFKCYREENSKSKSRLGIIIKKIHPFDFNLIFYRFLAGSLYDISKHIISSS